MEISRNEKAAVVTEPGKFTAQEKILIGIEKFTTVLFFFMWWRWNFKVKHWERAFKFRFGKSVTGSEPIACGLQKKLPGDEIRFVDIRTKSYNVPYQQLLTADNVSIKVDGVIFYKVTDPWLSIMGTDNADVATQNMAGSMLRNELSSMSLHDILHSKGDLAKVLAKQSNAKCHAWGIMVISVEIDEVTIPEELQAALAAEAKSGAEARAKTVLADANLSCAEIYDECSQIMDLAGEGAMTLKWIDTMKAVVNSQTKTVLYPAT